MGKILEALLSEQLNLDRDVEAHSPECQKLLEQGEKFQKQLEEKLNDEEKQILECLVGVLFDEGVCYAQNRFVRGYQLGVLLTMEIFLEQDTFLINGK